jgi:hypothetical protein
MMRAVLTVSIVLVAAVAHAQQHPATVALRGRVGIDDRLEAPSIAVAALDRARVSTSALPIFVRFRLEWDAVQRASTGQWSAIDDRLGLYAKRSLPVLLSIGPRTGAALETDAWVSVLETVARHVRGRVAGYQIEAATPAPDPREYAFQLKLASVRIKAIDAQAVIAQATVQPGGETWLTAVYAESTAPYVDVAVTGPSDLDRGDDAQDPLEVAIAAGDPSAARLRAGVPLGDDASAAAERALKSMLVQLGDPSALGTTFVGSVDVLARGLTAVNEIKDLLTGELLKIDENAARLTMEADGRNVTASVPHRLLLNVGNGAVYLAYWRGTTNLERVTIALVDQGGRTPVVRDALRREAVPAQGFSWETTTKTSRLTARVAATPLVLDFNYGAATAVVTRADVSATSSLSVEEIVALHQQAQARQTNAFRTFIASLRLELHFRPSPTQVFDVISDNLFFFAPDAVEWEERSFAVNGTKWGANRPALPLLQAEKVLTLPLDLRLTADYRYRLERAEEVDGRRCYVIAFDPVDVERSRYRGWIWVDTETFLRAKVQSIQTRLEGTIVSSEEIAVYGPVKTSSGATLSLPTRLSTKQILLVAGRNLLLEKEQWFSDFRVDDPAFDLERQAARAGSSVMFRDTDAGVRYLVRQGADRVVSQNMATSSKAMAFGTAIDPTFAFPLPIVGLNYLNFNFKGTQGQFAMLFGGVFVLGNLQTPKLGSTPFDASVDFFGIGVPGTSQRFDATGERKPERVLNIPMSTGLNLGYQFTPFQKISAGYLFRYDVYFRAPETAEGFSLPSNTPTHGVSMTYEYSRHGYRAVGSASLFGRTSWRSWGGEDDFWPDQKTYRRHSISLAKDFLFGPFQSVNVSAAWYGGKRLDRFSMYQFGLFDELRMHGVPSSGIRFNELVLLRGSYSFNILGIYRLDLFLDHARGRDPSSSPTWHPVTGTGAAVTLKAPWNTMFTADVGKSLIPDIYRGTGSVVLQFMLLKPF